MTLALSGGVACLYSDYHRCAAKYIQTINGTEVLCLAVSGEAPGSTVHRVVTYGGNHPHLVTCGDGDLW